MDREVATGAADPVERDVAAGQRAMIAALAPTLDAAGIRYWLMGGWAVDLHLGRTTRAHSDVDLAVFVDDRPRLTAALAGHGLVAVAGLEPAGELFTGGPCALEITYLVETATGEVVTPGFEHWPYVAGAFEADPVVVDGVAVAIMSVEALIDTKLHWQDHIGEPMRPHDRADLVALGVLR